MERPANHENQQEAFDWMGYYKANSTKAHEFKQANNHAAAKQVFSETLERIEQLKKDGEKSEWIDIVASTLHYEILDCLILLQTTPSQVNLNFHKYGEFLKDQIIRFSFLDSSLQGLSRLFEDDFTITDINGLQKLITKFESIIVITKEGQLSPEEKLSLGMIYLFLNKFFEAAFLFYGFSTQMVKECKHCKDLFRSSAERAKKYFDSVDADFLEQRNFLKYKEYVNQWFGIYADILDAKFALYVRNHVDDTNWAFAQHDMDRLWKDIDNYLNTEASDEAERQTNENAATHAMEVLLEIYETNALMSITNYEDSMKGLDRILQQAERLKNSKKIVFYCHLKRAIIARKYLMDMDFNRDDFTPQLQYAMQPGFKKRGAGSDDTQLSETQFADTQVADEFSFADLEVTADFDENKTTNALPYAQREHAIVLPDEADKDLNVVAMEYCPTKEFSVPKKVEGPKSIMSALDAWRDRLGSDFKRALKFAKLYDSVEIGNENHINRKWLAILQARMLLSDYYAEKFKNSESFKKTNKRPKKDSYDSLTESLMALVEEAEVEDSENEEEKRIKKLNIQLDQIELLLSKYAEKPKVAYFRQLAEIYVLLGRIHVEKIELMIEKVAAEEDIDVDKEPYVNFDKARDYLCSAYNILQDLEQDEDTVRNTALHNELSLAYSRLKFINYSKSGSQRRESTILPSINQEADEFRKKQWVKSFCGVLGSDKLADLNTYKEGLLFKFEEEAGKLLPGIHSVSVIDNASKLPEGLEFKDNVAVQNNVAENGMYKTYIGVFGVGDFFLTIESELPISNESIKVIKFLAEKIYKLFVIHQQREELREAQDQEEKQQLKVEVLKNTYDVIKDLLPKYIIEDDLRMYERFFSKLIRTYNEEHEEQIDPNYAMYIALIYDIGMAGIESSFLNKPTGLLPYEKIKLKKHIETGLGILRGIIGIDEFTDVLMSSMLHHHREGGNGYPEELNDLRRPDSPQNLMIFISNLTAEEIAMLQRKGELNESEKFLINALAISDTLKAITANREHRDKLVENDEQVQIFLQEKAVADFPEDFIEFVKRALYSDDGLSFVWE